MCSTPFDQGTWAFMSALSLQYPLKPNQLADDLESFVHVITYHCLRFHRHSMTVHVTKKMEPADLMSKNKENSKLAIHLLNYYHFNEQLGQFRIGGDHKLDSIKQANPPFKGDSNPTILSPTLVRFVNDLYKLLKEHYSTVDYGSLSPYRPPSIDWDQGSSQQSTPLILTGINPRGILNRMKDSESRSDESESGSVSQAAPVTAVTKGSAPVRDLCSHEHIRELFSNVATEVLDSADNVQSDATQDQFLGLPIALTLPGLKRTFDTFDSSMPTITTTSGSKKTKTDP